MQFKINYSRPNAAAHNSGWITAKPEYRETLIYAYEDHGFKASNITKDKVILRSPDQGIRVIEFRS